MIRIKFLSLFILLIVPASSLFAQKEPDYPRVEVDYLIIASKTSYAEAKQIAQEGAKKLHLSFLSRGAKYDSATNSLVYSEDSCKRYSSSEFMHHCTVVRGLMGGTYNNDDDGDYITIEETNNFYASPIPKDLFIVVVSSAYPGGNGIREYLKEVRKFYPDAYVKRTLVFEDGCGE